MTNRRAVQNTSLIILLFLFAFAYSAWSQRSKKAGAPNIIVILADDLGFSDIGCYGGEVQTPNLDRLARNGLRFSQFYNGARCCPSRASLLTGQYPHKVGLDKNGQNLTRNGLTIAEALKASGYQTAMTGKWHLSESRELPDKTQHQAWLDHRYDPGVPFAPLDTYPVSRGFDRHFGTIWGVVDYFDPYSLVEGTKAINSVPKDFYLTDAITQRTVDYLRDFSKKDAPFFLYVAYTAPHWPLHARTEDIAKYKGRYQKGPDALRRERYDRQVTMGLIDPKNTPFVSVMGKSISWNALTDEQQRVEAEKMAVHAAMIDRMDQGIGRIVATLQASGKLDNTVIFFLSDNGASPELIREPGYDRSSTTRDGRPIVYQSTTNIGAETSYNEIGPLWASAANTPFRYWKIESFEGGIHTPMIVHWPDGMQAPAGTLTPVRGHVMDIMPTCLALAGARYPVSYRGNILTPLDGQSLLPTLQGKAATGHETLFFEHEGGKALIAGDYKLAMPLKSTEWQLFHLTQDRTESQNLATRMPQKVAELAAQWTKLANQIIPKK